MSISIIRKTFNLDRFLKSLRTISINTIKALSLILISISSSSLLLSDKFFIFDLFSHFQLQYIAVGIILIILNFISKNLRFAIPLGVYLAMLFGLFILPVQLVPEGIYQADIFYLNSNYGNQESEEIINSIAASDPYTVALVEINPKLKAELQIKYGEPVVYTDKGALSCAVFTKRDLIDAYLVTESIYPICVVKFQDYTLYLIHPVPPLSSSQYKAQAKYFEQISALIKTDQDNGDRFILVGDFNSTYYSGQFRDSFGGYFKKNYYTWATNSLLTLPIDHALSNESLRVSKTGRLSSDHSGLFISY